MPIDDVRGLDQEVAHHRQVFVAEARQELAARDRWS
jgi:hypothetical protein